ncbi:succinylglutamate desuccinylase [Flavobacterium arcticum]|uniref:Succinylglutamate desuccinylase n=1 Tax=Flavobacterium arcticum TaxID=1784713 RepID=A0A345HBL5_9FLAO|nr:succinylglutamate desuccinylase/aspartoacylase family protein [Flavobacterium arcticum]AXG73975.1 succinylglutamate desuccinylase [Flavobacterium arcticum]KAF2508951.1 succinylglutamate desuccinylase/aspartoacylase family protein [Flavobacterium arcticum]
MSYKNITILGETILPGESKTINMEIARLHTMTKLKVPIIIERAEEDGPVVLFTASIHGDEINGTEIVRQLIVRKINKPKRGTIICIPVVNIFGFVNKSREFPDGRDLNRVFPGSQRGSLAGRFAWHLFREIIPNVDYCIDYHAGGASRFNAPQIRIVPNNPDLKALADVFNAPFTLYSKNISGSFRNACGRLGVKILLYEGGKSLDLNRDVTQAAVRGTKRFLNHLDMLNPKKKFKPAPTPSVYIERSAWVRATYSGLFQNRTPTGKLVEKGEAIALITDPFGDFEHVVKAPHRGYIINSNDAPIVYQGDAIFHITMKLTEQ